MPEVTENYVHIPVRDAGTFVDKSFRTITISEVKGIKAVIGKLKSDPAGSTKVQKYLFSTDKGWTMEKAKSWVSDHKAELEDIARNESIQSDGMFSSAIQSDVKKRMKSQLISKEKMVFTMGDKR